MPRDGTRSTGEPYVPRRKYLKYVGGAGIVGLAGCTGDGGDGTDDPTQGDGDSTADGSPGDGSDGDVMGGELRIGTQEDPVQVYDPAEVTNSYSQQSQNYLIMEGLIHVDFDGEFHPVLAESWEFVDDTTVRFTLREGVTFHNGEEFTAENVEHSLDRYEGTHHESDVYDWYESTDVVGDYEVDVNLQAPNATVLSQLAGYIPMVPTDVDFSDGPVGTGPYRFDEHQQGSHFRMVRYEDYWFEGTDSVPGVAPIETVTLIPMVETSARQAALETGEVDIIDGVDPAAANTLSGAAEYTMTAGRSGPRVAFLPVNFEPFDNAKVRRGVSRLIPRDTIVDVVFDGAAAPAYSLVQGLIDKYADDEIQQELKDDHLGYDPEQAATLIEDGFAEAGVNAPVEVTIVTNNDDLRVEWGQIIQNELNKSGYFEVGMETLEFSTYVDMIFSEGGNDDKISLLGFPLQGDPDFREIIHSSHAYTCCNINGYEHGDLNAVLEDAVRTYETEQRVDLYAEAQRIAARQAPSLPITYIQELQLWNNSTVNDWRTHPSTGQRLSAVYSPYFDGQFTWLSEA